MADVFLPLSNYEMDSCLLIFSSLLLGKGERKGNSLLLPPWDIPKEQAASLLCCFCMSSSKTLLNFMLGNYIDFIVRQCVNFIVFSLNFSS